MYFATQQGGSGDLLPQVAQQTARNGDYTVNVLPAGDYHVCVVANGHTGECFDDVPWPTEEYIPDGVTDVPVTAGGTARADFALAKG